MALDGPNTNTGASRLGARRAGLLIFVASYAATVWFVWSGADGSDEASGKAASKSAFDQDGSGGTETSSQNTGLIVVIIIFVSQVRIKPPWATPACGFMAGFVCLCYSLIGWEEISLDDAHTLARSLAASASPNPVVLTICCPRPRIFFAAPHAVVRSPGLVHLPPLGGHDGLRSVLQHHGHF